MEIHRPEGPTKSLKDFLIHIVIVTVGILIALGLEGIREAVHTYGIVRDARENFRAELQNNRKNLTSELASVTGSLALVDKIIVDLPRLRKNPAEFRTRVGELSTSGYFFTSSRWESALSMGALGHMSVDEVNAYAGANFLIHTYSAFELLTNTDWKQLEAFVGAHESPSAQDLDSGVEKLLLFSADVRTLKKVGEELSASLSAALERK
jgi:hypothetical protein